jgi:ABC-2 type transport system ATP-binding protein
MLEEMKIGEKDKISSLSKGAKEKLYVIVTLARRAKLYLPDEPLGYIEKISC